MRILFFVIVLFAVGCFSAKAQTISLGGGYVYGAQVKQSGVNFGGSYYLSHSILLTGDVNYFFPFNRSLESGESFVRRTEFNLIGKYRWFANDNLYLYPMAGISWIIEREKMPELNESDIDRSAEGGIVLGMGIGYQYKKLVPFAEIRHTISYLSGTSFLIGVAIKDLF